MIRAVLWVLHIFTMVHYVAGPLQVPLPLSEETVTRGDAPLSSSSVEQLLEGPGFYLQSGS